MYHLMEDGIGNKYYLYRYSFPPNMGDCFWKIDRYPYSYSSIQHCYKFNYINELIFWKLITFTT